MTINDFFEQFEDFVALKSEYKECEILGVQNVDFKRDGVPTKEIWIDFRDPDGGKAELRISDCWFEIVRIAE